MRPRAKLSPYGRGREAARWPPCGKARIAYPLFSYVSISFCPDRLSLLRGEKEEGSGPVVEV
jgi:hypothetical protein